MHEELVRKIGLKLWSVFSVLLVAFIVLMELVVEPGSAIIPQSYTSSTRHGIIPLAASVAIFCFFLMIPLKKNRIINGLASSTFAVLLIHDDPMVRNVLWNTILKSADYSSSEYLWLYAFVSIIIIYLSCVIIDKIYVYGIKHPLSQIRKLFCSFHD